MDTTPHLAQFILLLWQDALAFNDPHINCNLGKDITSQEKNLALYSFFKTELSPFGLNVNISSFKTQIWCICLSILPQRFNQGMFKGFLLVAGNKSHSRGKKNDLSRGFWFPKLVFRSSFVLRISVACRDSNSAVMLWVCSGNISPAKSNIYSIKDHVTYFCNTQFLKTFTLSWHLILIFQGKNKKYIHINFCIFLISY